MTTMKPGNEYVVIGHFRIIKDRLFGGKRPKNAPNVDNSSSHEGLGRLDTLPVNINMFVRFCYYLLTLFVTFNSEVRRITALLSLRWKYSSSS